MWRIVRPQFLTDEYRKRPHDSPYEHSLRSFRLYGNDSIDPGQRKRYIARRGFPPIKALLRRIDHKHRVVNDSHRVAGKQSLACCDIHRMTNGRETLLPWSVQISDERMQIGKFRHNERCVRFVLIDVRSQLPYHVLV